MFQPPDNSVPATNIRPVAFRCGGYAGTRKLSLGAEKTSFTFPFPTIHNLVLQ